MFVKDALEKEVGLVVELGSAVYRNFQAAEIENVSKHEKHQDAEVKHTKSIYSSSTTVFC